MGLWLMDGVMSIPEWDLSFKTPTSPHLSSPTLAICESPKALSALSKQHQTFLVITWPFSARGVQRSRTESPSQHVSRGHNTRMHPLLSPSHVAALTLTLTHNTREAFISWWSQSTFMRVWRDAIHLGHNQIFWFSNGMSGILFLLSFTLGFLCLYTLISQISAELQQGASWKEGLSLCILHLAVMPALALPQTYLNICGMNEA